MPRNYYTPVEFKALRFALKRERQRERSPWEFADTPGSPPHIAYRPFLQTGEDTRERNEEPFIVLLFDPAKPSAEDPENEADLTGWYETSSTGPEWIASDHSASLLGQLEMLAFGYIKYGRIKDEGRWGAP
jgi:hypothetical protein